MKELINLWNDPVYHAYLIGALIAFGLFCLLWLIRMGFQRSRTTTEEALRRLDETQHEFAGGLKHLADAQARGQQQLLEYFEKRFDISQQQLNHSLGLTGARTAEHLGALMQRLEAIDKAQGKIEKLSGDVLGLQDILSNKQTRGAFGEIQLNDILASALPPDSYRIQATLTNGCRADALVLLPLPPGPIVIDSKFPLEAYEALRNAQDEQQLRSAQALFKSSIRKHIRDIASRYIVNGETADGAIMFLPSEAIYAELHANFAELVREGFHEHVWIVSPTTCMATLTTMRAVMKDMRMREQATALRQALSVLVKDINRLGERVGKLDMHFSQATQDIEDIKISTNKVTKQSSRLENLEFEGETPPLLSKTQTPLS